jgi:xanthine/CO dehydrogenase XdhC/CoxF family maturation factor
MTHNFPRDLELLRRLLPSRVCYIGLLGPRRRAEKIMGYLERAGVDFSSRQLERLHAPMGLDLGAETAAEIALAALAEMQAYLRKRTATSLRNRATPIHYNDSGR